MLVLGTIFATASHPSPDHVVGGPAVCKAVAEALGDGGGARRPWLIGVGGISARNADEVVRAGADGCAVIRAVWQACDAAAACKELREAMARGVASKDSGQASGAGQHN